MASAFRKNNFAANQNISVKVNPSTGKITVLAEKEVVETLANPRLQVSLEEARRIKPDINIGDVVTVKSREFTYTHRVVEKLGDSLFRLKGDANEEPDPNLIKASNIIGRVILVFPFSHLYTPYGFALTLLVPAGLIIGSKVYLVLQFTKRRNKREAMRWRQKSMRIPMLDTSTLLLALILAASTTRIIGPHFISGSSSYFSDTEWTKRGRLRAGIWEASASVVIEPFTLNLDSEGQWITAYIETEFDENDIRIDSVMLGSSIPADWGEVQGSRLMVKFDRTSVVAYLIDRGYGDGDDVELTVSGRFIDDITFSASDTVSLIHGDDEP